MMAGSNRVFVSHFPQDTAWSLTFVAALQSLGYDVWYDTQGLAGGATWLKTVEDELAAREIFIIILTPASWASEWVQQELRLALAGEKRIIPVFYHPTNIAGNITRFPWVDVIGLNSAQAAQKVGAAITGVQPPVLPTPPVTPNLYPPPVNQNPLATPADQNFYAPPAGMALPDAPMIAEVPASLPKPANSPSGYRQAIFGLIVALILGVSFFAYNQSKVSISSGSTSRGTTSIMSTPTATVGSVADIKNIIIASELPTSGSDAGIGIPTENGVKLAVMEANLGNGYTISFQAFNDASVRLGRHDPDQGQANMQQIVANPNILGVVGAFNSGVSAVEIPIVQQSGGPVMISPSNTNPGLTLRQYSAANGFVSNLLHPAGKPNFYFRLTGNDVVQGALLAKLAVTPAPISIGAKTAFVLDDGEIYGQGLAQFFSDSFTADGGRLLGTETTISRDQCASFGSLATNIVSLKPDVIFFGGTTGAGAGCLKAAVAAKGGAPIPWASGDGVADNPDWFKEAGTAAQGIFGTVAAPDLSILAGAATFVADYKSHFGAEPYPYSAFAYDAANIEIQAIKNLIAAGQPVTRLAVRDQVASLTYQGATGSLHFDANGDNAGTKYFSVWAITSGTTWTLEQNVDASASG